MSSRATDRSPRGAAYTGGFFLDGEASDAAYVFARDSEFWEHHRAEFEAEWQEFLPLCGDDPTHFRSDARARFNERLWEMRLAVQLRRIGLRLEPPPRSGPDIKIVTLGSPIWVEATVAGRGTGPDAVHEPPTGQMVPVDHDKIVLRYTNAIVAKVKQHATFIERGLVTRAEPFVVAINAGSIPFADIDHGAIPDIARALFGLGTRKFVVPVLGAKGPVRSHWPHLPHVFKRSGEPIPTDAFLAKEFPQIAAVLFCASQPHVMTPDNFVVVRNPHASAPLPAASFRIGQEWFVDLESNELRCLAWKNVPRWARTLRLYSIVHPMAEVWRSIIGSVRARTRRRLRPSEFWDHVNRPRGLRARIRVALRSIATAIRRR